jgi:RNA polymerase sigma factor (sigma-70 family)
MASENYRMVFRGIERVFRQGSQTGFSERELLGQLAAGDEGAFGALLTRYGPLVLGVCRRLLYDHRDVEDAFQATFLVLLRKAGTLRDADALGPWLYGVAYRVAARVRFNFARRKAVESKGARPEAIEPASDLEQSELRAMIDEEVCRLPERYRRPVVLCYLEGRTHDEAARRLRCSTGSIRGRLDRARAKLRDRLIRRGLAPAAGLAALAIDGKTALAAVPASLFADTIATLGRAATAKAISSGTSIAALNLANNVFRSMVLAKLRLAASFLAAGAVMVALGATWLMAKSGSLARDSREASAPLALRGNLPPEQQQGLADEQTGPTIDFRIIDQRSGKPVPDVVLMLNFDRTPRGRTATNDAGRAAVALPATLPRFLSVVIRKTGYAPVTVWFPTPIRKDEIPASYTQALYPAETITGVVHDEQGRPLAGVKVTPTVWTNSAEMPYLREEFESLAPAVTDALGRWQCQGMPAGVKPNRVSIAFAHLEYESVDLPVGEALQTIRRGKVTVLPRGLSLAGAVLDPLGRPIKGASVLRSTNRSERNIPRAVTNADGLFRFSHVSGGETVLTVQAAGYAPEMQRIIVEPGLAPVEFRLKKGRTVHGRVVDGKGKPLAGATVGVDGWRGERTLDWSTTTGDEGEFQWADAPPDSFWISVSIEGYLGTSQREVPPEAGEVTIALNRKLSVRGIVTDAETHHSIRSFTLVPGMERGGGSATYWDRSDARTLNRGRYEIEFNDVTRPEGRRLRIEAEGYMPSVSRVLRDDEDHPVVNFTLRKATGISGVVRLPDGSPLAGADVVLVVTSHPAFLTNGQPPTGNDHRVVKTGGDGRFTFPAEEPPYTIVVLHDRGFAEHSVQSTGDASPTEWRVRPWGRIEGTLRIGLRPGASETLNLTYEKQGDTDKAVPWWSGQAKTADSGRFVFERVMPGPVTLSRQILLKQSASSQTVGYSHSVHVEVAPDATARLTLGGTGRPIVGRVAAPTGFVGGIDWTYSQNKLIPKATATDKQSGLGTGKGARRAGGGCTVKLEADGSFRVEDVEAGTYDFLIVVREPPRQPFEVGLGRDVIATARREVIVPAMAGGRSDEPLDLGAIPVTAAKKP